MLVGSRADDQIHDGRGNDTLRGGVGQDTVDLETGRDRVFLGPGDDFVIRFHRFGYDSTDSERDALYGRAGRDTFEVRNGFSDLVSCGGARDFVVKRDRDDRVRADCERR